MSQWDIFAVELLISEKVDFILVPMIHLLTGLHNALKHTAYVILLTFNLFYICSIRSSSL